VLTSLCRSYASAVNANDSEAYSKLFTADAIRMPPGTEPEYGPEEIRRGEQADYDVARWSIRSSPVDALQIDDRWIYGIAHVDATTTAHTTVRRRPSRRRRRGSSSGKTRAGG
jgi:ketosteroid isomerase-like protein